MLEEIHQGAVSNGISEKLWNEAVNLNKKSKRKKHLFISAFLVGFIFIFSGIFLTNKTNEPKFEAEFIVPEVKEEVVVKEVYADVNFQRKIDLEKIIIIKKYDETHIAADLTEVISLIKKEFPDFLGIKKIFFEFDETGTIQRNMIVFWDRSSQEKVFVHNTKHPYEIEGSILFSDEMVIDVPSQMLVNTLWDSLFEKIEFAELKRESLTLDIEIYSEKDKKYVRVSSLYPNSEDNASIEIEFYEYENVLNEAKTAFGKYPKISTGIFAEKYPKKRGPSRGPSTE